MHHYLGVKGHRNRLFPPKIVWKTSEQHLLVATMREAHALVRRGASGNSQGCLMRMGTWVYAQGHFRKTLVCRIYSFWPFSSVLSSCNALKHQMDFLHFVFSLNAFYEPLIFYLYILDPSLDVLFGRFTWFLVKRLKTSMELHDLG